ncbi:small capsid protein [Elephant endotheliotropic herpesvirus 5B]|uniref:Small capsomere-interacting protein n=1 Tax=Elephant endotheliotropic herpesvirus 5 TaxID=768738 RepID=A0A075CZL2_9BETA|nr:small capsid protein [Elephant endotheliotropic herpesvirus 5]AHC02843.1 small capsid protein [Elephant endotheliotropic herpesvirus 5]UVZ35245.1 small capsid protein [Elephant endotheliotropic herpesvirus 5B]
MSNSSAAPAAPAAGRGQRNVQDPDEQRKRAFLRHFNLEQQNLLGHPAIVMFTEKYYQRKQPFSATEETALKLELLRLFSNLRQNT